MGTPSADATVASAASCDGGRGTSAGPVAGGGVAGRHAPPASAATAAAAVNASKEITSARIVLELRSGESANDNPPAVAPGAARHRPGAPRHLPASAAGGASG